MQLREERTDEELQPRKLVDQLQGAESSQYSQLTKPHRLQTSTSNSRTQVFRLQEELFWKEVHKPPDLVELRFKRLGTALKASCRAHGLILPDLWKYVLKFSQLFVSNLAVFNIFHNLVNLQEPHPLVVEQLFADLNFCRNELWLN